MSLRLLPDEPDRDCLFMAGTSLQNVWMEELSIYVDVSHLSDAGFWDVVRLSRRPVVASHSNSRAVCPHRRNLTDDMFRAVRDSGGVAGLNLLPALCGRRPPPWKGWCAMWSIFWNWTGKVPVSGRRHGRLRAAGRLDAGSGGCAAAIPSRCWRIFSGTTGGDIVK